MPSPAVSAVIPTRSRPDLVLRAVRSALGQTFRDLEVTVVVDGPDPATIQSLRQIDDARLRVIELPQNVGGSDARNAGVNAARGEWIAFLDDDDEWFAEKIEKQLHLALESTSRFPIVCSQVIGRRQSGDSILPRKAPAPPFSEYLLARGSWSFGEGLIQSTTLFASRELLIAVPFTSGLRKHQDWDWVLRAVNRPDVKIEYIAEPLAIWYLDDQHSSTSRTNAWRYSLSWLRESRELITPRAYSGFIATQIAPQAAAEGAWNSFAPLAAEMCTAGKPKLIDLVLYFGMWLLPKRLRRVARRLS